MPVPPQETKPPKKITVWFDGDFAKTLINNIIAIDKKGMIIPILKMFQPTPLIEAGFTVDFSGRTLRVETFDGFNLNELPNRQIYFQNGWRIRRSLGSSTTSILIEDENTQLIAQLSPNNDYAPYTFPEDNTGGFRVVYNTLMEFYNPEATSWANIIID